ncbi:response regulator [Zhongshania borealis]|uniref:Response regulator n=1 Tax=Zhongshania borealis TaxID=889488 RepID=A0ABP7WTW3_9GAMM
MPEKHIFIVEDEAKIAELLADYFRQEGFAVSIHHDGNQAVEFIRTNTLSGVILDRMLPGVDGLSICQAVRQFSTVPIIMATARIDEIDRLIGLECGADDYVCKPFSPREIVARMKGILRRVDAIEAQAVSPSANKLVYRNISLDKTRFECMVDQQAIPLTAVEFRLLECLIGQAGRVFSRDELMSASYLDQRIVSDRTVDSHVKKLRKKLQNVASKPGASGAEVVSLYGVGYKIE